MKYSTMKKLCVALTVTQSILNISAIVITAWFIYSIIVEM